VTCIGDDGKALLARMRTSGAYLDGRGCLNAAILNEIRSTSRQKGNGYGTAQ